MIRFGRWFLRWINLRTLVTFSLLLVALFTLTLGMGSLVSGLETGTLYPLVVLAALLAWLLARSRLGMRWAAPVSILAGFVALSVRLGRLLAPLGLLIGQVFGWLGTFAVWLWNLHRPIPPLPESGALAIAWQDFGASLAALAGRFSTWAGGLSTGKAQADPVVTSILWGLLLWLLAAWAAWAIRRRGKPVEGLVPAGILLAVVTNYVHASGQILVFLLAPLLLLMVLVEHFNREQSWERRGIDYSTELRMDLGIASIPLVVAALSLALLAPSVSVHIIVEAVRKLTEKPINNIQPLGHSLGIDPRFSATRPQSGVAPGLPEEHLLGGNPELSHKIVMYITTGDFAPRPAASLATVSIPSYHWRTYTYNFYTGYTWSNDDLQKVDYRANEPSMPSGLPLHRVMHAKIEGMEAVGGLMVTEGIPLTVDRDYSLSWRKPFDPNDPLAGDWMGSSVKVISYQSTSLMVNASQADLRKAGDAIPTTIKDRYLQLPGTITDRERELAKQLTQDQATPYDQALAIQSYLRQFPYSLDVPKPPINWDVADYFLFELKKGYCDYYATSMVVLSRLAGIPARLVIGFAGGEYIPEEARYRITEADAHSWPELYFQGIGWVEFEPTAGQPEIALPTSTITASSTVEDRSLARAWLRYHLPWPYLAGFVGLCVLLGLLIWILTDPWRLRRLPVEKSMARLYRRMVKGGRPLVAEPHPGDTPYEFLGSLQSSLRALARHGMFTQAAGRAEEEARQLTDLYARAAYSSKPPNQAEQDGAIEKWQRLRARLWLARLLR